MPRGLFNWNYYFILFPIHVIVVFVTIAPQPIVVSQIPRWLMVTFISYAIMAIPFAFAHHFADRFKSFYQEISVIAVVGLVRGFAILDLSLILDLPSIRPYILRPLNSALVVPLWFLITHLIFGSRKKFQEEFHQMYARAVHEQIESLGASKKQSDSSVAEILSKKIDAALEPLRKQFESISGSKITSKQLADESLIIRSFVEAEIRPLSHDLWRSRKFQPPKLAFLKVLGYSLLRTRLPYSITLLPTIVFGLVGITTVYGFGFAIRQTFFIWIFYILLTIFYNFIFPKARNVAVLNFTALTTGIIVPGFLDEILAGIFDIQSNPLSAELIGVAWYISLLVGFSVYRAIENYYESIRTLMSAQLNALSLPSSDSSSTLVTREYASYLHGDVQSQLLSASMQMQKAADEGNIELGKKAIRRASQILRRDHQKYVVGAAVSGRRRLEKLIDAWLGIAKIELVEGLDLDISENSFALLNEIIEELVSNSIRHGGASEIKIGFYEDGGNLRLTIIDNGSEIKGGKKGLGSQLIRGKSLTYDYTRLQSSNKVVITLPK